MTYRRLAITFLLICAFGVFLWPAFVVAVLHPYTVYSDGFSVEAFDSISEGDTLDFVNTRLGSPLKARPSSYRIVREYPVHYLALTMERLKSNHYFVSGIDDPTRKFESTISVGQRDDEVRKILGEPKIEVIDPSFETWEYSRSSFVNNSFRYYMITVDLGKHVVVKKASGIHID